MVNIEQFCVRFGSIVFRMPDSPRELPPHVKELFDAIAALPTLEQCRKCEAKLLHMDTTFYAENDKFFTIPLPVCPECDLKGYAMRFNSPVVC